MAASTATVVRVKRKRTEDPVDALVLSFKRPRVNDLSETDDTANEIFKFTGSVPVTTGDGDLSPTTTREQLKKILADDRLYACADRVAKGIGRRFVIPLAEKIHLADVRLKSRRENKKAARQQRENLLLSLRAINMQETGDVEFLDNAKSEFNELPENILEDEDASEVKPTASACDITMNGEPLFRFHQSTPVKNRWSTIPEADYVYDYYVSSLFCDTQVNDEGASNVAMAETKEKRNRTSSTSSNDRIDISTYFNNLIGVYPYNLCQDAIDNEAANCNFHFGDTEEEDDDEDSNAESNWRNEYPEEDDDFDKRYDYYDQNYDSDDEYGPGEEHCYGAPTGDGSYLRRMQDLKLSKNDEEEGDDADNFESIGEDEDWRQRV